MKNKILRVNETLRKLLEYSDVAGLELTNGAVYGIGRDAEGIECPHCGGYAKRTNCTPSEIKEYGCGKSYECCARSFICGCCEKRIVGSAQAPEMEDF